MKYLIIAIIAVGFTLALTFGVEYNCEGQEMFPTYYGSPFVFKQKSLGSSMEYYYSFSGLFLNIIVWSTILTLVRYGILKFIEIVIYKKISMIIYKMLVVFLLVFAFLNISIAYMGMGRGFKEGLNYWYWDLNKEANDWGVKCEGEWKWKWML